MTLALLCVWAPGALAAGRGQPPTAAWTTEQVRAFVLETHLLVDREVRRAYKTFDGRKPLGTCYGEPAKALVKARAVLPLLEPHLQGKALQCFVASYFGCRVGDWLGVAGVALRGPGHLPHAGSAVKLIEQTVGRVVADVTEVSNEVIRGGVVDQAKLAESTDATIQARYTIVRDARRPEVWRIAEREPASGDWECRVR